MNGNIFTDLSPNINQRENQFTRAFSHILNADNELLHYILKSLMKHKSRIIKYFNANDYDVVIPFFKGSINSNQVYPDMRITDKNKKLTIYVENKIDSSEGKSPDKDDDQNTQLNKYLKLAEKCLTDEKWVIYITKNDESLDEKIQNHRYFAGQYSWYEISDIIEKYINERNLGKDSIICKFLEHMEANNLKTTKGYERDYALIWDEYNKFKTITDEYLDKIAKIFKNQDYVIKSSNYERYIFKQDWNNNKFDGFWINIGFELINDEDKPSDNFISAIAELRIRKNFYNFVNSKKVAELQAGSVELEKMKFKIYSDSNPVSYWAYKPLINKFYDLSKDKQIKAILKWTSNSVDQIENSNLLKLLKRQYTSYQKNKSSVD